MGSNPHLYIKETLQKFSLIEILFQQSNYAFTYIIAGCNGAGKTTAAYTLLPDVFITLEFVNADEIARGLSPFNPEGVAFQAGKIMLERLKDLLRRKKSFAFDTTLVKPT